MISFAWQTNKNKKKHMFTQAIKPGLKRTAIIT